MKKEGILWVIAGILLLIGVFADLQVSLFVTGLRAGWLNLFFTVLNEVTGTLALILLIGIMGALFLYKKKIKLALKLFLSSVIVIYFIAFLKILIGRARPFAHYPELIPGMLVKSAYTVWDFSFPSLHAGIAFAVLPYVDKEFPKLKYLWFGIACLIAFSRIYFGLHYLSDVIVGATIGYLIGRFFIRLKN